MFSTYFKNAMPGFNTERLTLIFHLLFSFHMPLPLYSHIEHIILLRKMKNGFRPTAHMKAYEADMALVGNLSALVY